jgi:hypothetical protein
MMPAGVVHYNGGRPPRISGARSYESYGVFCANLRIVVDSRPEEQMSSGRSACQLRRFPSRSAAENFARSNFGGVGASCSCR